MDDGLIAIDATLNQYFIAAKDAVAGPGIKKERTAISGYQITLLLIIFAHLIF